MQLNCQRAFQISNLCASQYVVDCIHEDGAVLLVNVQVGLEINVTSVQGLNALTDIDILAHDQHALMSMATSSAAVIFDTGASLGITYKRKDFDGPLTIPNCNLRLGGMANGLKIEGIGPVTWTFSNKDGTEVQIQSQCYYVPQSKMRLISPQRLFNWNKGVAGWYKGDEESFTLQFESCPQLIVKYDPWNHLPIAYAQIRTGIAPQINFALTIDGS